MLKIVKFVALASLLTAASSLVQAEEPLLGLSPETVNALARRVTELKAKVESEDKLNKESRERIKEIQQNLANATRETDELVQRFKDFAEEFKKGGYWNELLIQAQKDLTKQIERFRNGTDIQRKVVTEKLEPSQKRFNELDKRRDVALQQALKEIRRLELSKGDIEALIVSGNYIELEKILENSISAFEQTVKDAKSVNDDVEKATIPNVPTN